MGLQRCSSKHFYDLAFFLISLLCFPSRSASCYESRTSRCRSRTDHRRMELPSRRRLVGASSTSTESIHTELLNHSRGVLRASRFHHDQRSHWLFLILCHRHSAVIFLLCNRRYRFLLSTLALSIVTVEFRNDSLSRNRRSVWNHL